MQKLPPEAVRLLTDPLASAAAPVARLACWQRLKAARGQAVIQSGLNRARLMARLPRLPAPGPDLPGEAA